MTEPAESWIARKREQRVWVLREPKTAVTVFARPLGARGQYAGVTLSATPAESFAFVSEARWPTSDNYDHAVLDGVLDVLLCSGPYRPTGLRIVLRDILWHDIDSCAVAFYWAARAAAAEIAGFDRFGYPTSFGSP